MTTPTIQFSKWGGPDGLEQFIIQETGCKPYSGAGINPRQDKKTTILRSVDDTYYYEDDMSDIENPKYTLFGHNGDQQEHEKKFNEPLLNPEKTEKIYLYRVKTINKKNEYLWYGLYTIGGKQVKHHQGKDGVLRNIIVLSLQKT